MLAVAALSARALTEAAAADGMRVLALDVFGDVDTRRAASRWQCIASEPGPAIDGSRLISALRDARSARSARGWIAGAGFEARPDLLERASAVLPLLGTPALQFAEVRHPATFFGFLDAQGLPHPEVRVSPPNAASGWLLKDSAGCGGWQVRRAETLVSAPCRSPGSYWQAERSGTPMSATLLCNGRQARVLGFNRQLVQAIGDRPFVFCGLIGPLPVAPALAALVQRAAQALTERFQLRGLASLDFLLVDGQPELLELNPRPPASLSLYPRIGAAGPFSAHLAACKGGELPTSPVDATVRGQRIVFATRAFQLTAGQAAQLANRREVRDVPAAHARFEAGHPVCTLCAQDVDAAALEARLQSMHDRLLATLSTLALACDRELTQTMETSS